MERLYGNSFLSDVTVIIDGAEVPAHAAVLCCASRALAATCGAPWEPRSLAASEPESVRKRRIDFDAMPSFGDPATGYKRATLALLYQADRLEIGVAAMTLEVYTRDPAAARDLVLPERMFALLTGANVAAVIRLCDFLAADELAHAVYSQATTMHNRTLYEHYGTSPADLVIGLANALDGIIEVPPFGLHEVWSEFCAATDVAHHDPVDHRGAARFAFNRRVASRPGAVPVRMMLQMLAPQPASAYSYPRRWTTSAPRNIGFWCHDFALVHPDQGPAEALLETVRNADCAVEVRDAMRTSEPELLSWLRGEPLM